MKKYTVIIVGFSILPEDSRDTYKGGKAFIVENLTYAEMAKLTMKTSTALFAKKEAEVKIDGAVRYVNVFGVEGEAINPAISLSSHFGGWVIKNAKGEIRRIFTTNEDVEDFLEYEALI